MVFGKKKKDPAQLTNLIKLLFQANLLKRQSDMKHLMSCSMTGCQTTTVYSDWTFWHCTKRSGNTWCQQVITDLSR